MSLRRHIIAACAALGLCACGNNTPADAVDAVTAALDAGDMTRAQSRADALLADSAAFSALSATQLCRLSRALVHIDPEGNAEANDASAARCLARARALQSDSVTSFLLDLSGEDAGRLAVLDRVGTYLEIPRDSLVAAEDVAATDSITRRQP